MEITKISRRRLTLGAAAACVAFSMSKAISALTSSFEDVQNIQIARPGDPNFGALLETHFPGFSKSAIYSSIENYLLIVQNQDAQAVRALQAVWSPSDGGTTGVLTSRFIVAPHRALASRKLSGSRKLMFANEFCLISPFFVWRERRYKRKALSSAKLDNHLQTILKRRQKSWSRLSSGSGSTVGHVTGLIYKNHSYRASSGADLHKHFIAIRNAEHDEAVSLLKALPRGVPVTISALKTQIEWHLAHPLGEGVTGKRKQIYYKARLQFARRVLRHLHRTSASQTVRLLRIGRRKHRLVLKKL